MIGLNAMTVTFRVDYELQMDSGEVTNRKRKISCCQESKAKRVKLLHGFYGTKKKEDGGNAVFLTGAREISNIDEDDDFQILNELEQNEGPCVVKSEPAEPLDTPQDCILWLQSIGFAHYAWKLRDEWIEDQMDKETLKMLEMKHLV